VTPSTTTASSIPVSSPRAPTTPPTNTASCADVPVTPLRASPMLHLRIDGKNRNAAIDTGSAISCLSYRSWGKALPPQSPWRLRSATGQVSALYGPTVVPFDLQGHIEKFPVFIADISDECLIGADFLGTYRCYLSITDYSIQLSLSDGTTVVLRCSGSSPSTESRRLARTVRTTEAIRLEGREETILAASICPGRGSRWKHEIGPLPVLGQAGRVQRAFSGEKLQVVSSETFGLADEILVRVLNRSSEAYELPARTAVAECAVIPAEPETLVTSEAWGRQVPQANAPVWGGQVPQTDASGAGRSLRRMLALGVGRSPKLTEALGAERSPDRMVALGAGRSPKPTVTVGAERSPELENAKLEVCAPMSNFQTKETPARPPLRHQSGQQISPKKNRTPSFHYQSGYRTSPRFSNH